jgi:glycosyltransferase 2 family protein
MSDTKDFSKILNRIFFIIGIGLLLHLIFLLSTIDSKSFSLLYRLKFYHYLLITCCAFGPWIGHSFRIVLWSRFFKHPISFKNAFSIVMANDIGSAIAPTIVGGGPMKLGLLVSKGVPAPKATFMVLLSASEDLFFYGFGIVFAFIYMKGIIAHFVERLVSNTPVIIAIVIAIILLFVFKKTTNSLTRNIFSQFPDSWSQKIDKMKEGVKHYFSEIGSTYRTLFKEGKLLLFFSLIILFLQWFSKFTILAVILSSLGVKFTFFDIYIKQWIIWMSMLIVPTPGASGGAEASFLLLFKNQLSGDLPNLIVSTWRFFTYYFILILSVVLFNVLNRLNNTPKIKKTAPV